MPTIPQLEQALMDAANNGDMAAITSIVTTLTVQEKQQINPMVFGYTLSSVADYSNTNAALAASTAGIFMEEVGLYTSSNDISYAMSTFGMWGNLAGVNEMVDNTDPQIFPLLNSMYLGMTLESVADMTNFDPAGAAATAANFLSDLSLYTYSGSIGRAMSTFSMWGNLDGVNAVVDNADPQVFPLLSSMDLGITLENVANMTNFDPAGSVATAANLLSDLSLYTYSGSIGQAMSIFSMWGNLDGVNAVVDNTDPLVFPLLSSMDLGITLENVANMTNFDPAGSVATAANLLSDLSLYTHSGSIGQAMSIFSMWGNLAGVNAVVDNTDAQVFPLLSSMDLSITLENVANMT
ncbi:MAG: hypothetical protein ACAH83_09020, partial [Alphaproteobacteria bacterium]